MSQNTLVIADGTGLQVLGYMNNALDTLLTNNSGSSAPATTKAFMLWADTTNNLLKMRNPANTDWIVLGTVSQKNGSSQIPTGTQSQRDSSPSAGYFRFNTDTSQFEGYNGTAWGSVGAGAKGGGSNAVFYENDQVVTSNYTITSGKNAMSAGDITIADSVTVTVPTGSTWVIV